MIEAILAAHERATGKRPSFSLNVLQHVEEENEPVPYALVVLVAGGLECDPVDLVAE